MTRILGRLRESLGECVSTDPGVLARHRRDTWVLSELDDLQERPGPLPLAVVTPRSADEVARVLRLCRDEGVAVVPFGGGSGVCGAVRVGEGAVVLSTAALQGLVSLDDRNLLASFRAGTNGMEAERRVEEAGLTIGHWPQSIELSTVGGWVATRAAGQLSTGYGSIEDLVFALEVVLPDGSILRTRPTPRAAAGPDLRQLFMGSEGTLGVVTEVTFSLRPLPEARQGQAFHFPGLEAGLEALRQILRAGFRPPVVRLYDELESRRQFESFCPEGRALLLLLHEGPKVVVPVEVDAVVALCRSGRGEDASPAALDQWFARRNHFPGFRGFLEKGIVVDTIEVAATWDRVMPLYDAVTASLRGLDGMLSATAHASHGYRSGTNLYFTFVARPQDPARMAEVYAEAWRRTMEATLAAGGGIAHHHGIGRVRRDFLAREIGPEGVELLRAVKQALDPQGLLNPGVLLP